ncbi:MAG: response regulator [Caulobacteraceae bacterium]|nr:response regulator [Caulobacteraceae bacterium]
MMAISPRSVLIVEDEPALGLVLETAMEDAGYAVTLAGSGADAIALLETDLPRFGAVVTDVRLDDGPDGWAVARRARELRPRMSVIYMSAYRAHEWVTKGVPGSLMLAKPFLPVQLVTAVGSGARLT